MNNTLMRYMYIQDFFSLIDSTANIEPNRQVVKNILFSIINLYLKVRSVSNAKDVICKFRIYTKEKNLKFGEKKLYDQMKRNQVKKTFKLGCISY